MIIILAMVLPILTIGRAMRNRQCTKGRTADRAVWKYRRQYAKRRPAGEIAIVLLYL